MSKINRDQALVPANCTVLLNKNGSAPGMWFEMGSTIFVSVPGVPFEMKDIISEEVLPRLRSTGRTKAIFHRTILTQGVPESVLAEMLDPWETQLPANIKVAYLPGPMAVRVRLSAYGNDENQLQRLVESEIESLKEMIGEHIFGFDDDKLAGAVGGLLLQRGSTLSVAESCTGGYLSHLITSIPGCSAWYKGSVTAYSNEVKKGMLGVSDESLQRFGAVSEEVAMEMADGVKKALVTDYSVATTGIAGPDGGTDEKPVGTVWIAISGLQATKAFKFVFDNSRERNIIRSAETALQFLGRMISEDK